MRILNKVAHAYHFFFAQAHLIWVCVCASHLVMRMRVLLGYADAHLILVCACASHFSLRMGISFWYAHAHRILRMCIAKLHAHFGMQMRISF